MDRAVTCLCIGIMAAACPPADAPVVQNDAWRWFPLDGERDWTYTSSDTMLPYRMLAHKDAESEAYGETSRIHTITFKWDCLGGGAPCDVDTDDDGVKDVEEEPVFSWKLSADSSKGVLFHAYSDTTFAPPVKIASPDMFIDDVVSTESGGISFTSTYEEQGPCDVPYWRGEPPEDCITFRIADGGAGSPIAGFLKSIYQFGVVQFSLGGDPSTWSMTDYSDEL